MKVSFLGLGVMGYPMAGHLHRQGYEVSVYNRTASKAQQWQQEYGGQAASTIKEAVAEADVVLMCLGRDEDVISVTSGDDGVLASIKEGAVLIDHTTTSAKLAEKLAQACRAQQVAFLDAPVSGGEAGAQEGKLSIMVGGDSITLDRVKALLACYGKTITHIGGYGDGQRCKMVNQIAITGVLQGLSEALIFGQKAQLDMEQVVAAISGGAAGSWQLTNRAHTMLQSQYDFGFAIEWMIKDLEYAMDEAKRNEAPVAVSKKVLEDYKILRDKGLARADTSVLIEALKSEHYE